MKSFGIQCFVLLIILSFSSFGQKKFIIKINVKNYNGLVYLAEFYGDKKSIADTSVTTANGDVTFVMNENSNPGMYRIMFGKDAVADVIFNKEDVSISTDYKFAMDSLNVLSSVENKIYYDFLRADQNFQTQLELLNPLLDYYPAKTAFHAKAVDEFIAVQHEREKYIEDVVSKNKEKLAARIVAFQKMPFIDPSMKEAERLTFIKNHFFDLVSFDDVELLRSDVYTSKLISYLKLFSNRNFDQAQLEESFILAVDNIFPVIKSNQLVFDFLTDYLTKGFEKFGFEKVNLHIAELYKKEESCENENRKTDLQKRLDNYQKLMDGKIAPEFYVTDMNGHILSSTSVEAEYTILLFWASWCPHCNEMLPEMKKIYDKRDKSKYEIIAVSLDTEKDAWLKVVNENNYSWINVCDFKSWNSKIAIDYNIYATPTMFVLNRNRTIISKPISLIQFKEALEKIE